MSNDLLDMTSAQTFAERVRALFLARPGQWIAATEFERVGGRQAWRTRISDVRRGGLTIENRVRTVTDPVDGHRWRLSEYRYVPRVTSWTERAEASPDGLSARVEGRLF